MSDEQRFIDTIKANQGLIYKIARVYVNSREDREDLYQEIIYQLWRCFGSFRNESKMSTWMYRVALNTAIAFLSREKKKGSYIGIGDELLNLPGTDDSAINERSDALFASIRQLNEVERAIILLYLDGRTYDEIAAVTGFTVTNVGTRLGRIKQKLRSQLK